MEMYLVGGIVRDMLLGLKPKDYDFAVVLPQNVALDPYSFMKYRLEERGVEIFVETPEFLTIRGRFAKNDPEYPGIAGDFVLARKDSATSDGRRPDFVIPGSLLDDLSRRDFTVNAMAIGLDGKIIDYFGGCGDLRSKTLRFVGVPMTRIREDALRVMRAFRFEVTKGFTLEPYSEVACRTYEAADLLSKISEERRADELSRMFKFDTLKSLELINALPDHTKEAMFAGRVRLDSTLKRKPKNAT